MGCIFIGLPLWYVIGILITFSPEFAQKLGIDGIISASDAVIYSYIGLAVGDLCSGVSSQLIGSRKKILRIFLLITLGFIVFYLFIPIKTTGFFYFVCFCLGFGAGFWALFVTIAAEQFGTNLRSTTATTVPNFIRGTVIPLTLSFQALRLQLTPMYGERNAMIFGALIIGVLTIIIAFIAMRLIDETYGRDLNFEEID